MTELTLDTNPEVPVTMSGRAVVMQCTVIDIRNSKTYKENFQLILNVPVYDISSRKIALKLVTKVASRSSTTYSGEQIHRNIY